jgi:branched-chain amino acid transport system substrate-binding protein
MSPLITKLKRARPDVILHAGTNPDIMMFLRQSRSQNLKWQALIGHGAAYGVFDKLYQTFGDDANYIFDSEPGGAQLVDPKVLAPGMAALTKEMVRRYQLETKAKEVPPHLSMSFNGTWVLLNDILPRAIKKYGGIDSEALRKAALDTDIPVGGTIQGYGVKFNPPGHVMAGQNDRSSMPIVQYISREAVIIYPPDIRTREAVIPLPKSNPYAAD